MTAPEVPFEAPFEAPWQAQIFALTVALNEAGAFSWSEWSEIFGPRVQAADADDYWRIWSEALVALLAARGLAGAAEVREMTRAWQDAARATPHGTPITLPPA